MFSFKVNDKFMKGSSGGGGEKFVGKILDAPIICTYSTCIGINIISNYIGAKK